MSYGRPFGARTLHPVVARDRPVDTDENPLSRFVLVAQRRLTPLVISSILSLTPRTYATFIALVSALTAAKLHYLFTGH